jgi:hypothetical protein
MMPSGGLCQRQHPAGRPITAQQLAAQQIAGSKEYAAAAEAQEHARLQSKYEKDMSGFMKLSLSSKARSGTVCLAWTSWCC